MMIGSRAFIDQDSECGHQARRCNMITSGAPAVASAVGRESLTIQESCFSSGTDKERHAPGGGLRDHVYAPGRRRDRLLLSVIG